jgi:hypothetical protein
MIRAAYLIAAAFLFAGSAAAQNESEEIIVTGSRLQRFAADIVPVASITRKADFALVTYDFVCDTRDAAARRRELSQTLEDLIAKAGRRDDIELATLVEYEDQYDTLYFPKPYAAANPAEFKSQVGRSDTSVQTVIIKTPIDAGIGSLEGARKKISDFVGTVTMRGRTTAEPESETQLSIANVERYRPELIAAIRSDADRQRRELSASRVVLSGLEQIVRWERTGPLELKIYIPYELEVELRD